MFEIFTWSWNTKDILPPFDMETTRMSGAALDFRTSSTYQDVLHGVRKDASGLFFGQTNWSHFRTRVTNSYDPCKGPCLSWRNQPTAAWTTFDPFEVNMSLHLGRTYCIEIKKGNHQQHRQWFSMFLFFPFCWSYFHTDKSWPMALMIVRTHLLLVQGRGYRVPFVTERLSYTWRLGEGEAVGSCLQGFWKLAFQNGDS